MLVYVDDILVTGTKSSLIDWFIRKLAVTFPIRDLGEINYFLGVEATRTSDGLLLSQSKYLSEILQATNMEDSKSCATPMAATPNLSKEMGTLLDSMKEYRQVVGALQYLTITRPDIAFAVNKLAQFLHCATDIHWQACKRLLRYLKGSATQGLLLRPSSTFSLQCYSDSDWAGCPDDRRFTGGYLVYFGENLISWSSKKQPTVARSSTESEYKAIANATAELMWVTSLLREIGYAPNHSATIWCDNVSAIYLTSNPVFHARTKHVEIDYHFIRDQIRLGIVSIRFLKSADQIADILTKPLGQQLFASHLCKLRLQSPAVQLEGGCYG